MSNKMDYDNSVRRISKTVKSTSGVLEPQTISLQNLFTSGTLDNNLTLDTILNNKDDYVISNVKVNIKFKGNHKYDCSAGSRVEIYDYPGIKIDEIKSPGGFKSGTDYFDINKNYSYDTIPDKRSIKIDLSRNKSDCAAYDFKDVKFEFTLSYNLKSKLFDICKEGENSLTGTNTTPLFRSRFVIKGDIGDKCRQWALNMRDKNQKAVVDAAYKSFCDKYPDTIECRCINRTSNPDYNIINKTMTSRIPDGCWWIPCKDTFTYLVPSDVLSGGKDCQATYCGVFLDNIGTSTIDQNNISCTNNQNTIAPSEDTNDDGSDVNLNIDTDSGKNKDSNNEKPKNNLTLYIIIGVVVFVILLIIIIAIIVASRSGSRMSPYLSIPPPTLS